MKEILDFIYSNIEVFITLITMIVVWILGKLSKKSSKIKNELIIYQNIIVGVLVCGLYYICTKDLSSSIALSGVFATTGYDVLHNIEKLINKKEGK
jgi:glycerol-3-phosphate acyltransferase PlsY